MAMGWCWAESVWFSQKCGNWKVFDILTSNWERSWKSDVGPKGLIKRSAEPVKSREEERAKGNCFASRLLSDTEKRYSQCEKKALAVMCSCERFLIYLMGQTFILINDNRAIQLIYGNSASRPPARIERWAIRLSQFDFFIKHQTGSSNIADN